jgi:hypothetical protein
MKRTTSYYSIGLATAFFLLVSGFGLQAQTTDLPPNLHINGLGRTLIQSTELGGTLAETDTTTAKELLDGEFLLDLKVNASPSKNSEVQTILRLRNEFGGFYGLGMSVEVRELFARGVVADVFRYHVGDMDLKMTPYTLFQTQQEGTVHAAEIFKARQELIDYEQFYNGDGTRRMQGGKFDFGLSAGSFLPEVNFTGFITRIRGTDFFTLPTRFVGGGSVELVNYDWGSLSGNYINTFDWMSIGNFATGMRNEVLTLSAGINILKGDNLNLAFEGEMGQSSIREVSVEEDPADDLFDKEDTFAEGKLALELPEQNLTVKVGFRDVGPDFFSMGAQSKRVDFTRNRVFYNRIGNERFIRQTTLYDINRDRGIYTYQLSDVLMAYDPRFSNTLPYGTATPNRRGIFAELSYGTKDSTLELGADFMQMSEIRGQGTFELKSFTLARVWGDFHLHQLINRNEAITLTLGYQYEQTSRGGNEIEQVDLTSGLLETGLQLEIFENFDLLAGAKYMTSSGSDYIPQIVSYNEVRDFPPRYVVDDTESMLAAGFRYRFKEGVYLSAQWERFSFERATDASNAYQIDQIFILYNMNF